MKRQRIIAVSGVKDSGKTTLIEKLIPALAERGITTAVIKHDGHSFSPDRDGTDTHRLFEAGAIGTAIFDGEKFQTVKYCRTNERELIKQFPEADLIILEGFKHSNYPKIEIIRSENSATPVCDPDTLIAVVTDTNYKPHNVPTFGLDEINELTELLIIHLII